MMKKRTVSGSLKHNSIEVFIETLDNFKLPFFVTDPSGQSIIILNPEARKFFNIIPAVHIPIPLASCLDKELTKKIIDFAGKQQNKAVAVNELLRIQQTVWMVNLSRLQTNWAMPGTVAVLLIDISKEFQNLTESKNRVFRTIVETQELERIRFARDIHDSLGQQLSAVKFMLQSVSANQLNSGKLDYELLNKSIEEISHTIEEARSICFNLMPKTLENFGLDKAIREMCSKLHGKQPLKFILDINIARIQIPKPIEIALFRILQELINNTMKHACAKQLTLTIKTDPATISVFLEDDGIGFNPPKGNKFKGMGLKNVLSRVESYNGKMSIESKPNKGSRYNIVVPAKMPVSYSLPNHE
jgi:signal transduction histidine kinase